MAPLEANATARSNTLPLALFSGQTLLVAGLTTHVLYTVYRAARTLPPSYSTRAQEPVRRGHVALFSTLAFLSLAAVSTFSVAWRVISYFEWAEKGAHETPEGLWTGWYGTGEEGVGRWRLGDWTSDVDLFREADSVALSTPEGFLYTTQHFAATAIAAIFFGVEGRRRNISSRIVGSFVLLSATGSLGYALNLFFVLMLYTPVAIHSDATRRKDALFTAKAPVYYIPVMITFVLIHWFPTIFLAGADISTLRFGYLIVPLFIAFAPQFVPASWGQEHLSKAAAHRSYVNAFWVLGLTALVLNWKQVGTSFFVNTPPRQPYVYELFKNAIGKKDQTNRFYAGLANSIHQLRLVSTHPAISVLGSDVFLTGISLITWAIHRNLDINDVLENSVLSIFSSNTHPEKHVAFNKEVDSVEPEPVPEASPAKKRGRPRKNGALTNGPTTSASSAGSLRRSTRRKTKTDYESDAESTYEPPRELAKQVEQVEAEGAPVGEDLVQGGEVTALSIFLSAVGGLGPLTASILGAEVTGATST